MLSHPSLRGRAPVSLIPNSSPINSKISQLKNLNTLSLPGLKEKNTSGLNKAYLWKGNTSPQSLEQLSHLQIVFDEFINETSDKPFHYCVEQAISNLLGTYLSISYFADLNNHTLYSPTTDSTFPCTKSIVGFSYRTNQVISLANPTTHECYDEEIDNNRATIYTPLSNRCGEVICVVKTFAGAGRTVFNENDIFQASKFAAKFRSYSHLFLMSASPNMPFLSKTLVSNDIYSILRTIRNHFRARKIDFYKYDRVSENKYKLLDENKEFYPIKIIGFVQTVIESNSPQTSLNITKEISYDANEDGKYQENVMAIPVPLKSNNQNESFNDKNNSKRDLSKVNNIGIIVVRGSESNSQFNIEDIQQLEFFIPLIRSTLDGCKLTEIQNSTTNYCNAQIQTNLLPENPPNDSSNKTNENPSEDKEKYNKEFFIAMMFAEDILSTIHSTKSVMNVIIDKAKLLFNVKKAEIYYYDFDSIIQFSNKKKFPFNTKNGLVGNSMKFNAILTYEDYKDLYDPSIDIKETKDLICIPLISPFNQFLGCIELASFPNPLNDSIISQIRAFCILCSSVIHKNQQNQSLREVSNFIRSIKKVEYRDLRPHIVEVLSQMGEVTSATRENLYVYDNETKSVIPTIHYGTAIENASIISRDAVNSKQIVLFNSQNISQFQHKFEVKIENVRTDIAKSYENRISSIFSDFERGKIKTNKSFDEKKGNNDSDSDSFDDSEKPPLNICAFPIYNGNGDIIGVLEFASEFTIHCDDVNYIEGIMRCLSPIIEKYFNTKMYKFAVIIQNNVKFTEDPYQIPSEMKLDSRQLLSASSLSFDAAQWTDKGTFQLIYYLMDHFSLLESYNIMNMTMLGTIFDIQQCYQTDSIFTWNDTVNILQFSLSYISNFKEEFKKHEILAFVLSLLCSRLIYTEMLIDEGTTAKALAYLIANHKSIAYQNFSKALKIICHRNPSILANTEPYTSTIWSFIIDFLKLTSPKAQFKLLAEATESFNETAFSMNVENHRIILLKLMFVCGLYSQLARFNKNNENNYQAMLKIIINEIDIMDIPGIKYVDNIPCVENFDVEKSQANVMEHICLPFFEFTESILKTMSTAVSNVKANIKKLRI
ncbi:hypothetical protein TRFO_26781 [Tritrichomonas foetus]|uniref:PDEase domain-containing protein n=1 Tax=Tritrichomonas foetus TaxID=1144522 RepID=A0A1J4K3F3_9EUKA|nr:hypothetical protein TRFO_26781 [Tritrichomonas foetus]|eukprot:OHT05506.1 hypothetical protein TRFO_26781 [Tritrichomonas foetus]